MSRWGVNEDTMGTTLLATQRWAKLTVWVKFGIRSSVVRPLVLSSGVHSALLRCFRSYTGSHFLCAPTLCLTGSFAAYWVGRGCGDGSRCIFCLWACEGLIRVLTRSLQTSVVKVVVVECSNSGLIGLSFWRCKSHLRRMVIIRWDLFVCQVVNAWLSWWERLQRWTGFLSLWTLSEDVESQRILANSSVVIKIVNLLRRLHYNIFV